MARLFSTGFELNSSVEFDVSAGTIQSSTTRSGGFAYQISSLSSGSQKRMEYQYLTSNSTAAIWLRAYFLYTTEPTAANAILALGATSGAQSQQNITIKFDNTKKLGLFNGSTQIGVSSSALTASTWYRVELKLDMSGGTGASIYEFKVDGTTIATSTTQTASGNSAGDSFLLVGGNLKAEAQTTGTWYFDDIALNDGTGSFQTTYPGAGNIIHLKPSAAGDSNGFLVQVGGTAGAANNFTRVNEVPPDDATSYNGSAVLNAEDLFNVDDSGIGASDTVNVVSVGVRMADLVATDTTAAFKVEIEKTSGGTKSQSAAIAPNSTSWLTNAAASPRKYPLITYQDPDSSNWTQTTLDSMQIGYIQTVTNVRTIAVSNVWALVDYTPAAVTTLTISVSDTVTTSESTLLLDTDGVNTSDSTITSESLSSYSDLVVTRESVNVVISASSDLTMSVSDVVNTSESVKLLVISLISVSDTITTSESIQLLLTNFVSVSDIATTSESIKLAEVDNITVSDSTTLSENINLLNQENIAVSDATTLSETIRVLIPTLFVLVSDSITTSESTMLQDQNGIAVLDSVVTSESILLTFPTVVSVSDSVVTSESIRLLESFSITVSDSTTLSESISFQLTAILAVTVSDTITTSENVVIFVALYSIVVSDSVIATESVQPFTAISFIDTESLTLIIQDAMILPLTIPDSITINATVD